MHPLTSCTIAALLASAATLPAQGTGPGFTRKPTPSWIIINSFNAVPGKDIRHVHHVKLPTDKDGQWTTSLTVAALPSFWGGDGSSVGIVTATFDPYAGTLTPDTNAKALNSTASDAHMSFDPSGKWAIFDRPSGVWLASRSSTKAAFGAPKRVQGFGALRDVFPGLGLVDGVMKCFYADRKNILCATIDLKTATLKNDTIIVSKPLQAGGKPYAATPLIGAGGEVQGLWISEEIKPHSGTNTGDSDLMFASDLDPATPPNMQIQRVDWTSNGGPAGGFLSFTHDISPRWHVMHSEVALLLGDVVAIGRTASLYAAGVNYSAPAPLVTPVFAAPRTIPRIVVPGFNGWLGLNLAAMFPLLTITQPGKDGIGSLRFPIPNDARLRGLSVALQGIVIDAVKKTLTFTNTTSLTLR